jgi:hypothetical protein
MNALIKAAIIASGRSWWECRYADGDTLAEWDTLTGKILIPNKHDGGTSRWEDIEKKGMIGLRLCCPNGQVGELEAPEGCKFFQLKVAHACIGAEQTIKSHIIGVVGNVNGDCLCRAWEYPGRLIEFRDNVYLFRYENIGILSFAVQGLKI